MAEQQSKPEETEKKPSKKRLIIIIAAVLLLLGGAGAGYYFFMGGGKGEDTKHAKDDKHKTDEHSPADEEDSQKHGEVKSFIYFDMAQPMLVNFPKGAGASLVQVTLSFLVDSEEVSAALKKHEPMLRNNLMMKINTQPPEELKNKAGKEALRALILEEVNQVLSKMAVKGRVSEVFFTGFVMQ
ncbi:MAG: flagellar basal body-associated FliL family protein [Methylococcales bacterium]